MTLEKPPDWDHFFARIAVNNRPFSQTDHPGVWFGSPAHPSICSPENHGLDRKSDRVAASLRDHFQKPETFAWFVYLDWQPRQTRGKPLPRTVRLRDRTVPFFHNPNITSYESFPCTYFGNFFITDIWNKNVSVFGSTGTFLLSFGSYGSSKCQFLSGIGGVAILPNGGVIVSDGGNFRVQEFASNGAFQAAIGNEGHGNGQFQSPGAIVIHGQ
jgi:hypothetical protein